MGKSMGLFSRASLALAALGAGIGGVAGFLLRPAAPVIGQLPLVDVLTRGKALEGVQLVLRPTAEASFNYLMGGVVIGFLAGLAMAVVLWGRR